MPKPLGLFGLCFVLLCFTLNFFFLPTDDEKLKPLLSLRCSISTPKSQLNCANNDIIFPDSETSSIKGENLIPIFRKGAGTSLVVQWLRLRLPVQGVRVRSLVGELRSHMPGGQTTKTQNRSNIVTKSIKTL